jgi:hypothetical protein
MGARGRTGPSGYQVSEAPRSVGFCWSALGSVSAGVWIDVGPDDTWTMFHSYAFDVSVWEMWGPGPGRLVAGSSARRCIIVAIVG